MPTAPADSVAGIHQVRRTRRALVGAALALSLLTNGCAGSDGSAAAPPPAGPPASDDTGGASQGAADPPTTATGSDVPPVVEGMPVPPDLDQAFTALLDQRAQALLDRDREAFGSGLDQGDEGFLVAQQGYFDNLAQLPLETFAYDVDRASLVRSDRSYSVVVEITMQLEGFDALPVRSLDRYRFDRVGKPASGRYLLASVTDRAWEEVNGIAPQPWESRPIQVRSDGGVLAIFDEASVAASGGLMKALGRSVSDVSARVPYGWDATVVVYALSDTAFISSLDDLPGDDPQVLDGVAFTLPAGPGDSRTAATRIALNPRLLAGSTAAARTARERLLRHELTHVAVGDRDDEAPVWLSEGLAEWVSVQALPERKRRISTEALDAARRGAASMPEDATFNDDETELHYAVSWWACEYVAAVYGDSAPWSVLDAFAAPGTPEGPTIQALLQISAAKLAKRGTALMLETYVLKRRSDDTSRRSRDTPGRAG